MTSSPDNTVEKILSKFVGCKLPHPKYMTCEWCDELPEAKQSLDSHYLSIFLEELNMRDWHRCTYYDCREHGDTLCEGMVRNDLRKELRTALQDRLGGKNG